MLKNIYQELGVGTALYHTHTEHQIHHYRATNEVIYMRLSHCTRTNNIVPLCTYYII